jgi:hypothetical protein
MTAKLKEFAINSLIVVVATILAYLHLKGVVFCQRLP